MPSAAHLSKSRGKPIRPIWKIRTDKISENEVRKNMAKFCTSCGKEIPDGVAFGTGVGAAALKAAEAAPAKAPRPAPVQQPVYEQPVQQSVYQQPAQPAAATSPVVGTGTFFGLMFLFAIPVIGWIACIIMAFASKNENKKHFAKAILIWLIISLVLAVIGYIVFRWLSGSLMEYINQVTGGAFSGWSDILSQLQ